MGQTTISAPGLKDERQRASPAVSHRRRFLLIAVLVSVGIHLVAAFLIILLPRILPKSAQPQEQGTVELLMVEKKGAQPSQAGQPNHNKPAPPQHAETPKTETPKAEAAKTETPKTEAAKAETQTDKTPVAQAAPPPLPEHGDEPVPPPPTPSPPAPSPPAPPPPTPSPAEQVPPKAAQANPQPAPKAAEAQPMPPQTQEAPVFNLEGTESESNAIAMGSQVLPAMPDDRFRNRPPIYPLEAEMHDQHGSVLVVIHVSANGVANSADVVESSGYNILDQAALAAVRKWHFHPAMKEGRTIPFDMPFRFVFDSN